MRGRLATGCDRGPGPTGRYTARDARRHAEPDRRLGRGLPLLRRALARPRPPRRRPLRRPVRARGHAAGPGARPGPARSAVPGRAGGQVGDAAAPLGHVHAGPHPGHRRRPARVRPRRRAPGRAARRRATTAGPCASPTSSTARPCSRSTTRRPRATSSGSSRSAGLAAPVRYLTWDFEARPMAELPAALAAAGHDPAAPTLTIWEGVTMYLTERAIDETVRVVRGMSAPGSALRHHLRHARRDRPPRAGRRGWRRRWSPGSASRGRSAGTRRRCRRGSPPAASSLERDASIADDARRLLPAWWARGVGELRPADRAWPGRWSSRSRWRGRRGEMKLGARARDAVDGGLRRGPARARRHRRDRRPGWSAPTTCTISSSRTRRSPTSRRPWRRRRRRARPAAW